MEHAYSLYIQFNFGMKCCRPCWNNNSEFGCKIKQDALSRVDIVDCRLKLFSIGLGYFQSNAKIRFSRSPCQNETLPIALKQFILLDIVAHPSTHGSIDSSDGG